jgi:hypothetical protein
MKKIILTIGSMLVLTGCGESTKESLGLVKSTPDEFAVVTRAPLSVPPEFSLRPPRPGAARPMEISTQETARQTVFGVNENGVIPTTTKAEAGGFLDKVGANQANPNIRDVVDAERLEGVEDKRATADKILFWRDSKPEDQGTPINPAEERERLKNDGIVTIKKRNEEIPAP